MNPTAVRRVVFPAENHRSRSAWLQLARVRWLPSSQSRNWTATRICRRAARVDAVRSVLLSIARNPGRFPSPTPYCVMSYHAAAGRHRGRLLSSLLLIYGGFCGRVATKLRGIGFEGNDDSSANFVIRFGCNSCRRDCSVRARHVCRCGPTSRIDRNHAQRLRKRPSAARWTSRRRS